MLLACCVCQLHALDLLRLPHACPCSASFSMPCPVVPTFLQSYQMYKVPSAQVSQISSLLLVETV